MYFRYFCRPALIDYNKAEHFLEDSKSQDVKSHFESLRYKLVLSYVGVFTNIILESYIRKCDKYVWKLHQNYVANIPLELRWEVAFY